MRRSHYLCGPQWVGVVVCLVIFGAFGSSADGTADKKHEVFMGQVDLTSQNYVSTWSDSASVTTACFYYKVSLMGVNEMWANRKDLTVAFSAPVAPLGTSVLEWMVVVTDEPTECGAAPADEDMNVIAGDADIKAQTTYTMTTGKQKQCGMKSPGPFYVVFKTSGGAVGVQYKLDLGLDDLPSVRHSLCFYSFPIEVGAGIFVGLIVLFLLGLGLLALCYHGRKWWHNRGGKRRLEGHRYEHTRFDTRRGHPGGLLVPLTPGGEHAPLASRERSGSDPIPLMQLRHEQRHSGFTPTGSGSGLTGSGKFAEPFFNTSYLDTRDERQTTVLVVRPGRDSVGDEEEGLELEISPTKRVRFALSYDGEAVSSSARRTPSGS